jgi:AcrR family transcriptional regulator
VSTARQDLLDKTIAYVASHGLSDLSLRELAAGIGSSHRMLIYHFGNREGLLAAIVATIEAQQRTALELLAVDASSPRELVAAQWAQLSDPALAPYVVLFFEVLALALQRRPGTEGFLDSLTEPWLDLGLTIADKLEARSTPDEVRLGVAVVRGLLIDAVASGDIASATASLDRFLEMWDADRSR